MRADGFYWVRIIEHGLRTILLYRDGAWVADVDTAEADVMVLGGRLVPPTPDELARQKAHFSARLEAEWKRHGCDPRWDGRWLPGNHWVRCAGVAEPEVALFMEGTWGGLDWDDDWYVREGEPSPKVLTGPLNPPGEKWGFRWCTACLPSFDGFVREPDGHAGALAKALVIRAPVHDLVLLLRDVVATGLVQLEWQDRHPGSGKGVAS